MTTPSLMIRRIGKGYCAAGDGFYCFDEDLSRVLLRVAEFNRRFEPDGEPQNEAAKAETASEA
jgi:hypothetical protein